MSHFLLLRHPEACCYEERERVYFMCWSKCSVFFLAVIMIHLALVSTGCVTQTERVSPYEQEKDESVWEELRREFGWQSKTPPPPLGQATEPFYSRAGRAITETGSVWFADEEMHVSEKDLAVDRARFERKRAEGLSLLRMQQTDEQGEGDNE